MNIDTTGLGCGLHNCDISISSNGGNETFTVTVNIVDYENNPPIVTNVSISPTYPNSLDNLSAKYDYYDENGDLENGTTFRWFKNEGYGFNLTDLTTKTIGFENTTKDEIWKCEVTPKDGEEFGEPKNSTEITILNTAPEIENVFITPSNPFTTDDLIVSCDYFDADKDKESGTTYKWFKDTGNGFIDTGIITKTVPSANTAKGEIWKCNVTPKDGKDFGETVESNEIEIKNSKPTAKITSPENGKVFNFEEEIVFDGSKSSDADEDVLSFKWRIKDDEIGSEAKFTKTLPPGNHTITLFVDDEDGGTDSESIEIGVREKEEEVEKKLPDLKVESIEFSDSEPKDGDEIEIKAIIENLGEIKAEKIVVSFFLGEELIGAKEIEKLDAGETALVEISWEAKEGEHKIWVRVDLDNKIEEKDETNNELSKEISVKKTEVPEKRLPDLKVESIEFSDTEPKDGDEIEIKAIIKNFGDAKAEGIIVSFFLGEEIIDTFEIEKLDEGETAEAKISWKAEKGDYEIRVRVVADEKLEEKDETNNELSKEISVKEAGGTCMAVFFLGAIPLAMGVGIVRKNRK